MPEMTSDQLKSTILTTVKDHLEKDVASMIEAAVSKSLEANKSAGPPEWATALWGKQAQPPAARQKGEAFARYVRAAVQSHNDPERGRDLLAKWGDKDLADAMTKAMTAGSPTAGGFLVPEQFSTDVIELLRPQSVIRRLGPMTVPMPNGNLSIPKITSGATGYYVGESSNITPSQLVTGQVKLSFKKLAALVPMSNDLLRYSSPGADALVRDDAVRAIAQAENSNFIRGDGTSGGPRGLRYWVAPANLIKGVAAVALATVVSDLGKCVQALMANNIPFTRPAWIISPRSYVYLTTVQTSAGSGVFVFREEMMGGKLWGWPYAVSTGVPETLTDGGSTLESEVYFGDFADLILGESLNMSVDASSEAAYYDGSSVVAAFSRDETVVRVITEHDLALRRDVSFAVLYGIRWGV